MAKIGDIDIGNPFYSGGAFELAETPTKQDYIGDWEEISPIEFSDGWTVYLSCDTDYIIAQTEQNISREGLFEGSFEAVTRALDVFSIVSDYHGQTVDSRDDHILWWKESEGKSIIELVGTAPLETRMRARATINGEIQTPTIPAWHESFRYFRLSLLTEDIFDAYRNQFLAVEYFLSDFFPPYDDESITNWMERALREAHDRYDLSDYAPNDQAPVASIHGYQYEHVRCGMFHSQPTLDPSDDDQLTPRNQSDLTTVENALKSLTNMYSHMISQEFQNSPNRPGGLTLAGFTDAMDHILDRETNKIILTSESVDTDSEFQIPEDADILSITTFNESEKRDTQYIRSNADTNHLESDEIRSVVLVDRTEEGPKPLITGEYSSMIDISGFDELLVTKGGRLSSSWRSLEG